MTHMIAHQFIDGLNSDHKSSAEQGDWFGAPGKVEAVFIRFIFSNHILLYSSGEPKQKLVGIRQASMFAQFSNEK